jgi:NAD(P)-dependent dehydrogenase (short-subunit alcohol dehydrogenase family)
MAGLLEGKVAVITGAASGIGRASAVLFGREGAKLVVADVQEDKLAETLKLVKDAGGEAVGMRCDVAKAADTEALVAKAVATYGRLDCAYNNAGVAGAMNDRIGDSDEKNFDFTIDINLKGVFLCMKAEINQFLKQGGGGAIVNTSSLAGVRGYAGMSPYAATKHAVIGLTRTAAVEYAAKNIRVNAVLPGGVDTPMNASMPDGWQEVVARTQPMKRVGKPEEIAEAACWLLSDRASFVTAQALNVDGGWSEVLNGA